MLYNDNRKDTSTHCMLRHKRVKKSHGENSQSNKHHSMPIQIRTRRNRRQVAMVMSVNCSAEQIQHFVKTINLNKPQIHIFHAAMRSKVRSNFSHISSPSTRWSIKKCVSKQKHENNITPTQPFRGPFPGTTRVSRCQNRTSGLYGARED